MSAPEPKTRIVSQVHINQLNPVSSEVESGYEIKVYDNVTGNIVPVFVADSVYSPENAKTLIDAKLATVRAVHNLEF